MSNELHVYLARNRLPPLDQWQTAIQALGIHWEFPARLDVESHRGLVDVVVNGEADTFELAAETLPADEFLNARRKDDAVVVFTTGACGFETALLAAATLARLSKGRLFDPQTDCVLTTAKATKLALELMGLGETTGDGPGCYWEGRKVSPLEWDARVTGIITEIEPTYRKHRHSKRIEYLMQEPSGLWKIHYFTRHRNLGVDDYRSCFTLSLTAKVGDGLYSPFWVRGRGDHNQSVANLITYEFGGEWKYDRARIPRESLHASKVRGALYSFDDVRHNCRVAEEYLYPWMLGVLKKAAHPLDLFLGFAKRALDEGEFPVDPTLLRDEIPCLDAETLAYLVDAHKWHKNPNPTPVEFDPHWKGVAAIVTRVAKVTGLPPIAIATEYGHTKFSQAGPDLLFDREDRFRLGDNLWFACIFVGYFEMIWLCRDEIDGMRSTLRRLQDQSA